MIGQCLCEQVKFEITGEMPSLYQCHCKLCRKQGGSSSNTATIVSSENFIWLSGEEKIMRYKKPTGFSSFFCPSCGSPVPNPLRDSAYYWVPAGLFEDDKNLEIIAHIYTRSKAEWESIPEKGQHFEEMPDLDSFQNILQS